MQRRNTLVVVTICALLGSVLAIHRWTQAVEQGAPRAVKDGAPDGQRSSSNVRNSEDAGPSLREVGTGARSRVVVPSPTPEQVRARQSALALLGVTAKPANASIVRVHGAPSGSKELLRLEPVVEEVGVYTLPATGEWQLVAIDTLGASSAQMVVNVEAAGTTTVCFDFQRSVVIRGLVFDGVFGPRLPGAEVARVEAPIEAADCERRLAVDRAAADPEGNFEVRVPSGTSWSLRVQHPGYRTREIAVTAELGDLTVEAGEVSLEPVDALQVELTGLAGAAPVGYRIREGWEGEPIAFDSDARATLMVPRATPDLSLNLFAPDGVNLRLDLPGLPLDHSPLTIDLDGRREVEVEVLDWNEAHHAGRELHLCVTSADERGIARYSAAKVAASRVRAHAWGQQEVVAAVYEVSKDADTTLALTSFALADVGVTRVSVSLGRRPAWRLADEAGQGAADAIVIARFAERPRVYSMVMVADSSGIVSPPTGLAEALVANVVLSDGSLRCDLELPPPRLDGAPIDVSVGHVESYEITLLSDGAALAWHRVSVCSEAPLDLGQLLMSDDRGHIGPLAIRSGGRPRLVVHDPRLIELGRSFDLEPGMNQVSLKRGSPAGQR